MRALFIGTVQFSASALQKLVDIDVDVVGVCAKQKSKFNSDFVDLKPICEKNKIPLRYTDDVNSQESVDWIKRIKPDIIFCFGWSSLIKTELLALPRMGVLGFHPAYLPMNRGRHPIVWTLCLGLKKTASTFFFMDEGADSGDILSQKEVLVTENDSAQSLYSKITAIAMSQIEEFIPALKNGTYVRKRQDETNANYWRKRTSEDGKIDFRMTSDAINNLVRALSKPYVGAHIDVQGQKVKVWKVEKQKNNQENYEPGKVLKVSGKTITVKTYDSAINIIEHDLIPLPDVGDYL